MKLDRRRACSRLVAVLSLRSLRRRTDAAPAERPARRTHLYRRFLALTAINPTTVVYFVALIAGLPGDRERVRAGQG